MKKIKIAASILAANMAHLGDEVTAVLAAGAHQIHFDVMDNHYVPNLTFGASICGALRDDGVTAPIDVHLMAKPVDRLISSFIAAGANAISFHPEASEHVDRDLHLIKAGGCQAGLALNPATSLSVLDYTLPLLDFVLVMTVNPGFGGQKFIDAMLAKISAVKKRVAAHAHHAIDIMVDGGVNHKNIAQISAAGANISVIGSALFVPEAKKYPLSARIDCYQTVINQIIQAAQS